MPDLEPVKKRHWLLIGPDSHAPNLDQPGHKVDVFSTVLAEPARVGEPLP